MATVTRGTARTFLIGTGGLTFLAVIVLFALTASSGLPGAPTTTVRAAFSNVGAPLTVGDDVRENSSRVGRVSDVRIDQGHAVVTLVLDGNVPVYSDARAAIWDQSALAKKFIELDRGHPDAGRLGDQVIAAEHNVDSADLDQVLDVLDPPTRAALSSTLKETGGGVAGHSQDLHDVLEHAPAILTGLGNTSAALSAPQTDLPALLQRADQLAGALQGHEQQLSDLVAQAGATMRAVGVDNGKPLQDSIKDLPGTLTDARAAFHALDKPLADTRAALVDVCPGVEALSAATPDLRGVLREAPVPLNRVPGVATTANPALADLTRTVADARPLVPAVSRGLTDAALPVNTLALYSDQVVEFFRRIESMVSTEVSPGVHGARVGVAAGPGLVTGALLPNVLQGQDAYPAPGQADRERTWSPLNNVAGGNK